MINERMNFIVKKLVLISVFLVGLFNIAFAKMQLTSFLDYAAEMYSTCYKIKDKWNQGTSYAGNQSYIETTNYINKLKLDIINSQITDWLFVVENVEQTKNGYSVVAYPVYSGSDFENFSGEKINALFFDEGHKFYFPTNDPKLLSLEQNSFIKISGNILSFAVNSEDGAMRMDLMGYAYKVKITSFSIPDNNSLSTYVTNYNPDNAILPRANRLQKENY